MQSAIARLLLLFLLLPGTTSARADRPGQSPLQPQIVAHRGAMMERPENTLASIARAVELGADVVEIDVRQSRDGVLFLLHDRTLNRTTDGEGEAEEKSWSELRELDAGAWFDSRYAGENIPSLAEALEWGRGRTVFLLDLKGSGRAFAEAVAAVVRQSASPEEVVIGVRSAEQARDFRRLLPENRQLGFIRTPGEIGDFAAAGADLIRLWLRWLRENPALVDEVRGAGRLLMVNGTTGHPEEATEILAFRPDWILVDDPARLRESLELMRGPASGEP